jgi:hypothetical protein
MSWLPLRIDNRQPSSADGEWLAEPLIDLEENEPARLRLVAALEALT